MTSKVEVILLGNDQLSNVVNNAKGALGNFGGVAQSALGFVAGGLISTGLAAVAGGFGAIKDSMIGGNAEFERYQTQFGVLLGSTDLAKERLEALAKFGASTPFELPEVVRADKILQGFGLHAEESAKRFGMSGEQIRILAGDLAAGTGQSFETIATYLGKFSSGATGEVLSRFQELGIVTKAQLAEMGLEFSKSGELLTPVDEAFSTILGVVQEKYGGMMNAQSATFEGMVSNFQDFLGAAGRTIGAPFFDLAKDGLGKVLELLNGAMPILQMFSEKLGQALGLFLDGNISGGVKILLDILGNFLELIGVSGTDKVAILQDFWSIFNELKSIDLSPLMGAFGELANAIGLKMPESGSVISTVTGVIKDAISAVVNVLNNYLVPAFTSVVQWVSANWPIIKLTIETVMTNIRTVITTVLNYIQAFWNTWGNTITNTLRGFTQYFSLIFQAFSLAFQGDWRGFGAKLREAFDLLVKGLTELWDNFTKWFMSVDWNKVGEDILKGLAAGITGGIKWIEDAAKKAAKAAEEAVKGFMGIRSPASRMIPLGVNIPRGLAVGIDRGGYYPVQAMNRVAERIANNGTTNNFNLTVNTNAKSENVVNTFGVMRTLYGVS